MSKSLLSLAAWVARWLPMPIKKMLYQVPPLARLLRLALNRAAPDGLSQALVAAGSLQGASLHLDLQTEKDYWLGTYEPELQDAIADYVQPGMVVYDVGANIGYISLMLARKTGLNGRVFSFEALPANLERLRANLALNEFASVVAVVPAAVIETSRPVRFLVGPSGGMGKAEGSAGRQEVDYPEAIETMGISLDDFVFKSGNPAPDVVKMDIEGGEVLALPGMRRLLMEKQPLVFIELHGEQAARTAWDLLRPLDYRLCRMERGYSQIKSLDELNWKSYMVMIPTH